MHYSRLSLPLLLSLVVIISLWSPTQALSILKGDDFENSEILFENPELCGSPFADPVWVPVLDMCNIECDVVTEYCVENEDLQQQCKPLPEPCQELIKQRLGLFEKFTKKELRKHIGRR